MFLYNLKNGNGISKNYVIVIKYYGRRSRLNKVIFINLSRSRRNVQINLLFCNRIIFNYIYRIDN